MPSPKCVATCASITAIELFCLGMISRSTRSMLLLMSAKTGCGSFALFSAAHTYGTQPLHNKSLDRRSASAPSVNARKGPPKLRKLIVCNIVSLDGFFSGPGGNVMAMPFDNGFSDYNAERLRAAETLLFGGNSYAGFQS